MPLFTRIVVLLAALALVAGTAACGSGEDDRTVPPGAIALVGDREISKEAYDRLLAQAQTTYEAREQDFPAAGTPEYAQLRNAIVRNLVEQTQFEIAAEEFEIEVTEEDIDTRLEELKEQFFQGDEEKYSEELEKQGLTDEIVREDLRSRLLSERIFEQITEEVEVTDEDVESFYEENKDQFAAPASREVRHILVEDKKEADRIRKELDEGGDFAELAKEFSQDPGSAEQGGNFTAQQGATVEEFDKTAFELETGEISDPVQTQFGWHIIEALEDVQDAATQELSAVELQIREQLLEERKNERINEWIAELRERFADDTLYAPGFEPPPPDETTTDEEDGETPAPDETTPE